MVIAFGLRRQGIMPKRRVVLVAILATLIALVCSSLLQGDVKTLSLFYTVTTGAYPLVAEPVRDDPQPLGLDTNHPFEERTEPNVDSGVTMQALIPPQGVRVGVSQELELRQHLPCSCWNSSGPTNCCSRQVVRTHKMGYNLLEQLIVSYNLTLTVKKVELKGTRLMPRVPKNGGDFRMVFITRNMYDAITSGYLYHKSGRECWRSPDGRPRGLSKDKEVNLNWEENLLTTTPPVVPRNGRSICKYLEEESEQDGLRAFIEFSLVWYWKLLMHYYKQAFLPGSELYGRFGFTCYEDFADSGTERDAMGRMMDFLYPGGYILPAVVNKPKPAGGHATSTDKIMRARLRDIIQELDEEIFNGTIALHQSSFECNPHTTE
jgi:hypothetical protein